MRRRWGLLIMVLAWAGTGWGVGQDTQPARETASENGRFYLRLRPGRPGADAIRGCKATLFERSPELKHARQRWERFLVNDVAPEHVVVRNDGRIVATLDEVGRGGARHALVLYGEHGELLRHFLLPDLLRKQDWKRVRIEKQSVEWLTGAKFRFVDSPPQFVVLLPQGRRLCIDLETLRLCPEAGQPSRTDAEIPAEFLSAWLATQEAGTFADTAPAKTTEMSQTATRSTASPNLPEVLSPPMAEPSAPAGPGVSRAAPGESVQAGGPTSPPAEGPVAGPDASVRAIPPPDPAHPVDYLGWINELTGTAGSDASSEYESAIARLVVWEGDDALLRAAMKGDPAATTSEKVTAWLDANAEAIEHFRRATRLDFNGWRLHSEDGSVADAALPNLAPLRQLARITLLDGKRLEAEAFAPGAASTYVDTLAAGAQLGRGTTLVENLVGIAIQSLAGQALLDLVAGPVADKVAYDNLAEQLNGVSRPTRPLAEALQVERAMFLDSLQRMYEPEPRGDRYVLNRRAVGQFLGVSPEHDEGALAEKLWPQLSKTEFERTVHDANALYDAIQAATEQPYPQARQTLERLESELQQRDDVNPMLKTLVPSFAQANLLKVRGEAVRRAASLVSNLMAYRQEHGGYPASLGAFGGAEFTVDPFTQRPFHYRRLGNNFTLYSAGVNGQDDGGVHDARGEKSDLVFWPRPIGK